MCLTQVICPSCGSENISNSGHSDNNVPRYRCRNDECETKTFMLEYRYKAYEPDVKEKVVDMAINGSGTRDTSRVLSMPKTTVIDTLNQKESGLVQVNPNMKLRRNRFMALVQFFPMFLPG